MRRFCHFDLLGTLDGQRGRPEDLPKVCGKCTTQPERSKTVAMLIKKPFWPVSERTTPSDTPTILNRE
jgi:hypothetical protein